MTGCSLLILAGGGSRRMGRDKANLPAGEVTLVEHLARRLRPVVDEVIVAAGRQREWSPAVRSVADCFAGMGPLAGMHAGLLEAGHQLVWVVACDLPDVEPELGPFMAGLAGGIEAVVPCPSGEPEGVCAIYRRELAPRIEGLLKAGTRSVRELLAISSVRYVDAGELRAVDPELQSFRNLNTPADYDAWIRTR